MGREGYMSKEEFVAIGARCFGLGGTPWKYSLARAFDRTWNTVWSYATGRRAIPQDIAAELRLADRLYSEVRIKLDAETVEQKYARLLAVLEAARLAEPILPRKHRGGHATGIKPPSARATEVARLKASGCSNDDIAARLGVRKRTVVNYVWKYEISPDGDIRCPAGKSPRWST